MLLQQNAAVAWTSCKVGPAFRYCLLWAGLQSIDQDCLSSWAHGIAMSQVGLLEQGAIQLQSYGVAAIVLVRLLQQISRLLLP